MLGLIVNETKVINKFKTDYIIDYKPTEIIQLLMKKYYLDELNKEEMYKAIMIDLEKSFGNNFIYTNWDSNVRRWIKRFYKNISIHKTKIRMDDIEKILITKGELEKISNLNNLVLEKIAFVMLVYAKISNIQLQSKEGWIRATCSMICKEAHVNLRGIEQQRILNNLYKLKYIKMSKNNSRTNIKINYFHKDSDDGIVINDFDGVVYQYLIWKGEKWKKCEQCGKYFKQKNNRMKYCNICRKEKEKERAKEGMRKLRENGDIVNV